MAELPPSKLGTKNYWDNVYDEELRNFDDNGDEGEIWFGEETVELMVEWALDNIPPSKTPFAVEIGSGNGTLILALAAEGYPASHLSGIDYSSGAVELSKKVATERGHGVQFTECDFLSQDPQTLPNQPTDGSGCWDLMLDKGTFDAIALGQKDAEGKSPAVRYPERVHALLKSGGIFLITSCNFTEDELKEYFIKDGLHLEYHSRIQHPTYEYGGKKGSIVSSLAFKKADK